MYLVQKNRVRGRSKADFALLRKLARLSKNLFNVTLYTTRQYHEETGCFLPYEQAYHVVKTNENYRLLPSQVAQQTMKHVHRAFKSFFGLLRAKQQGKITDEVHVPFYLPKDGFFACVFAKDQFKVEGTNLRLSLGRELKKLAGQQFLYFQLPPHVRGKQLKEVRLLPRYHGYYFEIEYVYQVEPEQPVFDYSAYLSLDLGVTNLAALVSTTGPPVLLDGKLLKSYNRWWNKEKARYQHLYDKQGYKQGTAMSHLLQSREGYIRNYLAQAVNHVIQYCLRYRIGNVVVGNFSGIKQGGNLGRKNNQNFQNIPFALFKQKLQAKCAYHGIKYAEVEESNTSKTCSSCGNMDKKARVHRGLYICTNPKCKLVINADLNGAINILKKVNPNPTWIGNSGGVNPPARLKVLPSRESGNGKKPPYS
ncbi:MAG: RNA-guided endonuclease InsQ/TnpB family protein [Candidatus Hodarchaeales archaeon]